MTRHLSADVLGPKEVAQKLIALGDIGGFGADDIVSEAGATQICKFGFQDLRVGRCPSSEHLAQLAA